VKIQNIHFLGNFRHKFFYTDDHILMTSFALRTQLTCANIPPPDSWTENYN